VDGFAVPDCQQCGGVLKPNIVFFGDNVPMARIDAIRQNISASDSLLVLGSSLSVFSGYRILLQAFDLFKTIAIINIGETRGDKHADLKISTRCGELLQRACVDL
jgi:NAD+-dependent protein deacetylase sirtuin 4